MAKRRQLTPEDIAKAQSPEAKAKRKATRAAKTEEKAIRGEILSELRNQLIDISGKKGTPYYTQFLQNYLQTALTDTKSSAAANVASAILSKDVLEQLDENVEKTMSRDLDFQRYRVLKRAFREQREVIYETETSKSIAVCAGRRSGKTDMISTLLNYTAIKPNSPCFYINKTFSNAIKQMWTPVLEIAERAGLAIAKENKADGYLEFANGSSISFRGNSNNSEADKLRGFKSRLVVIDEAGHQMNLAYLIDEVVVPLLSDYPDSTLVLAGTPAKIPKTKFEKACKEWKHFNWNMTNNPFISNPQEVIQAVCESKGLPIDSPLIQREYFGKWFYDTEAQVFKDYCTFSSPPKIQGNGDYVYDLPEDFIPNKIYIGNDYGWSAYNAFIGIACNTNTKQAYVFYEGKYNQATVTQIVDSNKQACEEGRKLLMRDPYNNISDVDIYGDYSDSSIIYEMSQTYGLPANKCYKYDKATALEQLAEEGRSGRLLIPENGILADEYEQTLYKRDEEDIILPEIDDDLFHPDAIFALLYASRQMFNEYKF